MHCLIFNVVDSERSRSARPAGAYRIAHVLRQHGWDAEVIDFARDWSLAELIEFTKSRVTSDTKFFGFSHMFSTWSDTLETFVAWAKITYPNLKFISGSSVNPMFKSEQMDYYVQGYGENALLILLKYLFSNGERPIIRVNTGKRIIDAIHDYPSYPMHRAEVEYQVRDYIQPNEWLSVEFSRGCMFACDFCNFPLIGIKGDMTRDADNFDLEMKKNYDTWGTVNYIASDETFNDRPSKIKKFADVVEKLPFQPFFTGFVRPDLLVSRQDDRVDMARMNFRGHYYGIESFNHASAKLVGKGMDSERLKAGLLDVKKYFESTGNGLYRGTISLILGLPYETEESIMKSREWLLDNWKGQAMMAFPLSIPKNSLDAKSKFFDYAKYGYTEMDVNDNVDVHLFSGVAAEEVLWKNDNMDIFKATQIMHDQFNTDEFFKAIDLKADSFDLACIYYTNKGLNQRLNLPSSRVIAKNPVKSFMFETVRGAYIDNYKRKKLS